MNKLKEIIESFLKEKNIELKSIIETEMPPCDSESDRTHLTYKVSIETARELVDTEKELLLYLYNNKEINYRDDYRPKVLVSLTRGD